MQIVNLFYEIARQHKLVKGFRYGKSYEKGAGSDIYPLVWLDDPILGQSASPNTVRLTVNVDFLGIPKDDADVVAVQTAAYLVGLSFNEKIKELNAAFATKDKTESFNFITLRNYYDDDAAGVRFTFTLIGPNPSDLCVDYFDPDKQLEKLKPLPEFKTDNPNGCAVFSDKPGLPNFEV